MIRVHLTQKMSKKYIIKNERINRLWKTTKIIKNTNELSLDELEQVSGGCLIFHDMQRIDWFKDGNDVYECYRCSDCGEEKYMKNEKEIQPSEYFKHGYRIDL